MAAGGTSANVTVGAGRLWYAPLNTTEPTNASTALPSAWVPLGYTEEGTTVSIEINQEPIEVAEEFDPVSWITTSRRVTLSVAMAEATRKRLALALGMGANEADSAATLEPPNPGSETGIMLVWDSEETAGASNTRWLFRRCKVSGTVEISRKKAPNKALLPVTFNVEKPSNAAPFKVFPSSTGLI
jgi:hypothetical protein